MCAACCRVAVSCHPGRTKHYQTHFMSSKLVLCDCPGIVFPRLDVSLPMQVWLHSIRVHMVHYAVSGIAGVVLALYPQRKHHACR
jgi:GTP-binding protein EngB required for normal cell division